MTLAYIFVAESLVIVCDALSYILDNNYIRIGTKLYRQIVGIPMNTNCALSSLGKLKIFLVNPKQIATQMFLELLVRYILPRQHTKSIPKSENTKLDFFLAFSGVHFGIFCYSKHSTVRVIYCEFTSLLCIF